MNARTEQAARARRLAALHVKGRPLILFNVWDAGSAMAVRDAGASAIATGSWSVAAANGYEDGEKIPLDLVVRILERITACVALPLTLDFESGYADGGAALEENTERIVNAGAAGINFEDQRIGDGVIYPVDAQAARIASVRAGAARTGVPLFINARTDLFLNNAPAGHATQVEEAIARGRAYMAAGANGFFVPGLRDEGLIERVCAGSPLPVNVLWMPELPPTARLAEIGVARISYGPRPYRHMIQALAESATVAMRP